MLIDKKDDKAKNIKKEESLQKTKNEGLHQNYWAIQV